MPAGGKSPDADPIGIEIVLSRIGAKPTDCSFAIFDLRRKRCSSGKAVIDARHGVFIPHEANSWTSLFSTPAPAATMDPNDHWQRTRDLLRTIEVEREDCAIDAFIYQISLNGSIGKLRRPPSRHNRLRDLPTQHGRDDCHSKPGMSPAHQPNHPIF